MIKRFHYQCPCNREEAATELQQQLTALMRLNPSLLGTTINLVDGVLNLELRVGGRDQWRTRSTARRVAATMLRRVKLDWTKATQVSEVSEATSRSLTKETGRNPGHTPRGRKSTAWQQLRDSQ